MIKSGNEDIISALPPVNCAFLQRYHSGDISWRGNHFAGYNRVDARAIGLCRAVRPSSLFCDVSNTNTGDFRCPYPFSRFKVYQSKIHELFLTIPKRSLLRSSNLTRVSADRLPTTMTAFTKKGGYVMHIPARRADL